MYYLEDKSQGDIAKALGVSRSSVSRMLSDARDRGIIEIRIHPQGALDRVRDLERQIKELTGIQDAVVTVRKAGQLGIDCVGEAAARIFEDRVGTLASLGVSWGRTVACFVDHVLVEPIHPELGLYPLIGGMPTLGTGLSANDAIETLAHKGGFRVHRFEAPAVVESELTWNALRGESSVRRAIADAANVQAAVVGVGAMGLHANPHVVDAMHLEPAEKAEFLAHNPVGDICGQFFDARGEILGPPTSERIVGISLEQLKQIPTVVGLAGGSEKATGVAGALRTGVLDVIVLDDELAAATIKVLQRG